MESSKTSWNFVSRLLIIGLMVVFGALVVILGFGLVRGTQVSPQDFRLRSYSYYRIPGTNLQITPVKYTAIENSLGKRLRDGDFLVGDSAIDHWDPVSYQPTGQSPLRGRAWVLAAQLTTLDGDGEYRWLVWTKAHPEQAKILWKYVAEAARADLYFAIPELLRCAQSAPNQLEVALAQIMRNAYQEQIAASTRDGEMDRLTQLQQGLDSLPEEP